MARDLNELWGWVERLIRRVDRLYSGAILENSSITNGRLRLIGAVLRLDSGALLDLVGEWRLRGPGAITGDVFSEGKWTQVGDWDSTGNGDLAGDVTLSGNFDLTGKFTSEGIRIEDGKIHVGTGASEIIIDGATGAITTGNVKIQDGKITVGVGASQIVIDGATGKITVGGMAIDPADGGKVTFPGGAQLRADVGNGIQMQIGNVKISAQATFIALTLGTRSITISSSGITMNLATALKSAWPGSFVGAVVSSPTGDTRRIIDG